MIPKLNTIFHGDCYEILPQIPDNFFNCMITDPPYILDATLNSFTKTKFKFKRYGNTEALKRAKRLEVVFNHEELKNTLKTLRAIDLEFIIKEGMRICSDKVLAIYGFNNEITLLQYINIAFNSGYKFHLLHLNPTQTSIFKCWFLRNEIVIVIYDPKIKKWSWRNPKYFLQNNPRQRSHGHPFKKGIPESEWLLKAIAKKGGKIIDPFCGGGSLLRLAMTQGYQIFGIEQNKYWADKVNRQIKNEDAGLDEIWYKNQYRLF